MARHEEKQSFVVKLANADNTEEVTISIPMAKNLSEITSETTTALLNAATATVTGGGALIQTKSGADVTQITESYLEYTSKTWVDEKS